MIKAVIFDIGGVLSYDVWENVLLDPCTGIAVEYNLDRERVFKLAHDLLIPNEIGTLARFISTDKNQHYLRKLFEKGIQELILLRFDLV